jgi:hypothetical protein
MTPQSNFRTFYISINTLFRSSTGESWNGIMHDCYFASGPIAVIFWAAFMIFSHFILTNVFVAVIYENFNDIK